MACRLTKLVQALQSLPVSQTTTLGATVIKKGGSHAEAGSGAIDSGVNLALANMQAAITKGCGCFNFNHKSTFKTAS